MPLIRLLNCKRGKVARNGFSDEVAGGYGMTKRKIESKSYPNIFYTPGEEIWLDDLKPNAPFSFYFTVEEMLTTDEEAMLNVAFALDQMDQIEEKVRVHFKENNSSAELLQFFFEHHLSEMDEASLMEMLQTDDPESLTEHELVDHLVLKRFGTGVDAKLSMQVFMMDFSFDPDYTDELVVVYLDADFNVITVSHES